MQNETTLEPMLTVNDLVKILKVSHCKAYQLVHAKGFPSYKLGGSWRIDSYKLRKWLNTNNEEKLYL